MLFKSAARAQTQRQSAKIIKQGEVEEEEEEPLDKCLCFQTPTGYQAVRPLPALLMQREREREREDLPEAAAIYATSCADSFARTSLILGQTISCVSPREEGSSWISGRKARARLLRAGYKLYYMGERPCANM